MQFMGQGATFTDYVQTRICEIAARASPASSVCSVWRIGVCEIAANACIFFLSFSRCVCVFMCLCVYVFMQFMGQGATFTDYVQIRGCRKVAQKSVQVIYRSEVTFNTVLPHSILRL